MSRYIDADVLMKKLNIKADCKECNSIDHFLCCLRSRDFVNACEAINSAPSIDIVRCKECKYWHDHITTTWCSRGAELRPQESGWVKRDADDFCSYGEREDER